MSLTKDDIFIAIIYKWIVQLIKKSTPLNLNCCVIIFVKQMDFLLKKSEFHTIDNSLETEKGL